MNASGLHSQTIDTTGKLWINRSDALKVLAQADSLPSYKQLVSEKQKDVDILIERIKTFQERIDAYKAKDTARTEIITLMQGQLKDMKDEVVILKKEIRVERHKKTLISAVGILATGVMVYLYITK
jgi:nicotinamide riboside kinase